MLVVLCEYQRHVFEIFNNTSASQSRNSGSKAGSYTFNIDTIFVQNFTLNRDFRHNLASSCYSISDFMKIFFFDFISVERKQKSKDLAKLTLIILLLFLLIVKIETPFIYYNVRRKCLEHHCKYSQRRNTISNSVSVITLLASKMICKNNYPNRGLNCGEWARIYCIF